MQNAKIYLVSGLIIATVSSLATYSWNNQSLAELVEENNRNALIDCLTQARNQPSSREILQATKDCNSNLFTNLQTPRISTGSNYTGTVDTAPLSSDPLWLQLIPQASASSVTPSVQWKGMTPSSKNDTNTMGTGASADTPTLPTAQKYRTPIQIYNLVKHLGYREKPTISLIQSCKDWAIDPRHCILVWLTLMYNEAGNQQKSTACISRNNCFGVQSGKAKYSTLEEWTDTWVVKYNRYWYKAQSASYFYSSAGRLSPSRYCVSESSSNTKIGCPNWLIVANKKWGQIKWIIYLK